MLGHMVRTAAQRVKLRAYQNAWQKRPEVRAKRREWEKLYRERNREKLRAAAKEQYWKSREQYLEKHRRYRIRHPERLKTIWSTSRLKRIDKCLEYDRLRKKIHPERIRIYNLRRTEQKKIFSNLTFQEWLNVLAIYNYTCAYCGSKKRKLTQDHVLPLSKGGHHTQLNVVPACLPCNMKKGAKFLLPPPRQLCFA